MTALEAERRRVQRDLRTVHRRERAVAKVFTYLLILVVASLVITLGSRAQHVLAGNVLGFWQRLDNGQEGSESLPLERLEVLAVDQVCGQTGDVRKRDVGSRRSRAGSCLLVNRHERAGERCRLCELQRRKVGTIASLGNFADLTEGGNRLSRS